MTVLVMHEPSLASPSPDLPQLCDVQPAGWLDDLPRWSARAMAAGERWDAVRITGRTAPLIFGLMHQQTRGYTGPVVIDVRADAHYWLIRPGYEAGWDFPAVRLCTTGTWVVLPPTDRPAHRVHWLTPPRAAGRLVHAPLLHATIASTVTT
jgi:hypothetical protein